MHDNDPYRSPGAPLEIQPPSDPGQLVLADRGTRLGAVLLDAILGFAVMLPIMLVALFFSGVFSGTPPRWLMEAGQGMGIGLQLGLQVGFAAVGFVLFVALQGYPLARYGQTWGKRWLGIRIVDLHGRKPAFWRMLLLRYGVLQFVVQVPCLGPLLGLTDSLFIFRDDHRCVHDLMAGTQVVRGSPDAAAP